MLKYVDTKVCFQEVPDEISLCINVSGCPCKCEGCHSSYLAEDTGNPLNWGSLNAFIHINNGITCVAFMGGDSSAKEINDLACNTKRLGLKTCWYSGRNELSNYIELRNFDFIKLGPYIKEQGPLTSKTTNQKFYKVENGYLIDITNKFWK